MEFKEYSTELLKRRAHRKKKLTGSFRMREHESYYAQNRPRSHEYVLAKSLYRKIIKLINIKIADLVSSGINVKLPQRMGDLEIRKKEPAFNMIKGKLRTNLLINWKETQKLWFEDEEARRNKTLIRFEIPYIYVFFYNKGLASYTNMSFMEFTACRSIRKKLAKNILEGRITDAHLLTYKK